MHEFLLLIFIFSLDALHVSEYISPSSGATFRLYILFGICRYMPIPYVWLLCGYRKDCSPSYSHTTARHMLPAYTKCDVQLIKLPLMMD